VNENEECRALYRGILRLFYDYTL